MELLAEYRELFGFGNFLRSQEMVRFRRGATRAAANATRAGGVGPDKSPLTGGRPARPRPPTGGRGRPARRPLTRPGKPACAPSLAAPLTSPESSLPCP